VAVRQLSALYLAAASAYALAIVVAHHPVLADRTGDAGTFLYASGVDARLAVDDYVVQPVMSFAERQVAVFAVELKEALSPQVSPQTVELEIADVDRAIRRLAPNSPPSRSHQGVRARARGELAESSVQRSAPASHARHWMLESSGVARADAPQRELELAPATANTAAPPNVGLQPLTAIPAGPGPTTEEIARVESRLKDNLTSEMLDNFQLFLYVSKAATGPLAQRMYVFEKQPSGDLALTYNWPVSTGREKIEFNAAGRELPSFTPSGYFELDPHRFYVRYMSRQWHEPMPYAMFFNWKKNGVATGLAIHSASGDDISLLGTRASAGCVRLAPEAAHTLFYLIKTRYRGLAPRFAVDRRTGTMSNDGIILHDPNGHAQLAEGYKVLVFIEDYGGQNVVAAMY
jgi:lipoprotein-anchoring transpeptidase ErfK/SrfK